MRDPVPVGRPVAARFARSVGLAAALGIALAACAGPGTARRLDASDRREVAFVGEGWPGFGVAYGPYRAGQRPGGPAPTEAQLREDLGLLARHWRLLRTYGTEPTLTRVVELIHEARLPLKVLVGAWIAPEVDPDTGASRPGARHANAAQVAEAVRLANRYPGVVLAVVVGNETQVDWSAHRLPAETLLHWLAVARLGTRAPVGTADDFKYWLTDESRRVAAACDFLVTHAHPLWNGQSLDAGLAWTRDTFAAVARAHPGRPLVLGETGWATDHAGTGEQARLIQGETSEAAQARFHRAYRAWVQTERITATWFEAFDEPWKGSDDPHEVEKHWGLFRADRTPKAALGTP